MFHRLVALLSLATGLAACAPPINNQCKTDEACEFSTIQGRCLNTWCALPGDDCPSGFRYHDTAGNGLSKQCVPSAFVPGKRDAGTGRDAPRPTDAGVDAPATQDGSRPDAPLVDGPRTDGPRRDGPRMDAPRAPDASRPDGPRRPDGAAGLPLGAICTSGVQCNSNFCADGVCCNTACDGLCVRCERTGQCTGIMGSDPNEECAGSGTCGGVCNGAGTCTFPSTALSCGAPACGAQGSRTVSHCDGAGMCIGETLSCAPYACSAGSCRTGCTGVSDCAPGAFCDNPGASGTCRSNLANGAACGTDSACMSAHCVDGFCCGAASCPDCQSCTGSGGTCAPKANGLACGAAPSCSGGQAMTRRCMGGSCTAQSTSCGSYTCDASSMSCLTSCGTDAQCASGYYCTGGTCLAKKALGSSCQGANACTSGFCVGVGSGQSVCCDSACSDSCHQCSPTSGACTAVANGTSCGPSSCTATSTLTAQKCMSGTCQPQATSCGNYVCESSTMSCPMTCTGDSQCAESAYCTPVGTCSPKQAPGSSCSGSSQCTSGFCTDGYCCDSACSGTCQTCNSPGKLGVCSADAPSKTISDARITNTAAASQRPSLAFTGGELAVSWFENGFVYWRKMSAVGDQLEGIVTVSSSQDGSIATYGSRPANVWNGSNYLVGWAQFGMGPTGGAGYYAYFQKLGSTGNIQLGAPVQLSAPDNSTNGVSGTYDTASGDFVAIVSASQSCSFARLSKTTAQGTPTQIYSGASIGGGVAANTANGDFFTVLDGVRAIRTNASGTRLSSDLTVGTGQKPQIAWSGSEFGLCWQSATGIQFARVSAQFAVTSPPAALSTAGSDCTVAWAGDRWIVAWAEGVAVRASQVPNSGLPSASMTLSSAGSQPHATFLGGTVAGVVWSDTGFGNGEILFNRLTCQ